MSVTYVVFDDWGDSPPAFTKYIRVEFRLLSLHVSSLINYNCHVNRDVNTYKCEFDLFIRFFESFTKYIEFDLFVRFFI